MEKKISEIKVQKTNLETKASSANEFELQTKLELLEDHFKKFNVIQDNLEIIIGGEEDSNDREIVE